MSEIGQRMRELREKAKLSQAEIAQIYGTNKTTITRMENGKTAPSIKILVWWADYFDKILERVLERNTPQNHLISRGIPILSIQFQ